MVQALNRPVPDIPFPKLNDAKDLEQHFKTLAARGLTRWVMFSVVGLVIVCITTLLFGSLVYPMDITTDNYNLLLVVSGCLFAMLPLLWPFV